MLPLLTHYTDPQGMHEEKELAALNNVTNEVTTNWIHMGDNKSWIKLKVMLGLSAEEASYNSRVSHYMLTQTSATVLHGKTETAYKFMASLIITYWVSQLL